MRNRDWKELCARSPVILDGAFGTRLQALGLQSGESSESWNLLHPDKVQSVSAAYVQAGSQIILTNTFGACRIILEQQGLGDRTYEINRTGAGLALRAAGDKALVFGSVGPSGKMLMTGEITADDLSAAFDEQVGALRDGGVDGLVVETMSDLDEAKLAVKAAASTGLPVVASMVFDSGPEKDHTMMGISTKQAAEELKDAGAWAVGANCGQGPKEYLRVCKQFRQVIDLPLWMKPNAGLPEIKGEELVYTMKSKDFAEQISYLIDEGATFVGGCCGTSPAFIEMLASKMLS